MSRSLDFENSWPQNCTKLGKFIDPSTPLRFMSLTRSCDVPAALADLVERGRLDAVLLGRLAGDGVQPDVGDLVALVEPHVGAVVLVHELRRELLPLVGKVVVEERGRLDDVVVDADQDQVLGRSCRDLPSGFLTFVSA